MTAQALCGLPPRRATLFGGATFRAQDAIAEIVSQRISFAGRVLFGARAAGWGHALSGEREVPSAGLRLPPPRPGEAKRRSAATSGGAGRGVAKRPGTSPRPPCRSAFAAILLATLAAAPLATRDAQAAKTTLTLGMPVEPTGLDPTIAAPVAIREVTWANLFEGLVKLDRDGKVVPLLAKSWTVSPDGLTYTFKLQEGVKFHDGQPMTSAEVKFSFDRARAPTSTNAQKQIFAPIDTIDTPDAATVVIRLKQPSGNFLYFLAWGDASIVSPASAETNRASPVGTGPVPVQVLGARRPGRARAQPRLLGRQAGARERHLPVHHRSAGAGRGPEGRRRRRLPEPSARPSSSPT